MLMILALALPARAQWYPYPPAPPPPIEHFPGLCREECVNFDFACVPPSAALRLRIQRTCPANLKVLHRRALFVLAYDPNPLAKGTAVWVKGEIEQIGLPPH